MKPEMLYVGIGYIPKNNQLGKPFLIFWDTALKTFFIISPGSKDLIEVPPCVLNVLPEETQKSFRIP